MSAWSDRKKWWMDLLRSLLAFGATAVLAYFLTDRLRESRDEDVFLRRSHFEERSSALRDFGDRSIEYIGAGHLAFIDLYQWDECSPSTENMRTFMGSANIGREVAMAKLLRMFRDVKGLQEKIDAFGKASKAYWEVFDPIWDRRLDACLQPRKTEPDPERRRSIWSDAEKARDVHEQQLQALREAQDAVFRIAEPALVAHGF